VVDSNPPGTSSNSENQEITERFRDSLDQRGRRSNFSPTYLKALPKSMAEKLHTTPEEEEQILYLYAATYSIHKTASACGLSLDKVRAVVYSVSAQDSIAEYRDQMKISVLQKIEEAQVVLLEELQDPDKLKVASITMISEVFSEISATQANLISSIRANQSPTDNMDPGRVFSGEELEYLMLLRRRLSIGAPELPEEPDLDAPLEIIEAELSPDQPSEDEYNHAEYLEKLKDYDDPEEYETV
jgi:hypothetical protein